MAFLTDRKRAEGLGSAKSGTEHFWSMTVSSVALLILVPLFIFTFGAVLGEPYEAVVAYYARPFPALIAGLTLIVGFHHFKGGGAGADRRLRAWPRQAHHDPGRYLHQLCGDGGGGFMP